MSPLASVDEGQLQSPFSLSQRAYEIAMHYSSKRKFHQCDLVLCPPGLERFGLNDVKHRVEIHDLGHRAALERMPEISRLVEGR